MSGPSAKVIADSVSLVNDGRPMRVTTMEVVMHRFVLAEFNTHRVFSRNSASSRAIPVAKQLKRVQDDPAVPLVWASEQRGMQGGDEVPETNAQAAERAWLTARDEAVRGAGRLVDLGVHKSVVNRLLEPFLWHTVIVTSTEWENFFEQRCSPLAQPEIRAAAEAMRDALRSSQPVELQRYQWHLPYVSQEDLDEISGRSQDRFDVPLACKISAARCARVSYLTHEGVRDISKDLELYHRLVNADPPHWSPLEHVCTPASWNDIFENNVPGNLTGWHQLRHIVSGESRRDIADFTDDEEWN